MIIIRETIPCEVFSGKSAMEIVRIGFSTTSKSFEFRIPNGVPMKLLQEEIVIRIRSHEILVTVEPDTLEEV